MQLTTEQLEALKRTYRLSPRETQVLGLLLQGLPTNDDIAQRLGTTAGAVNAAVHAAFAKTGTRSRHELVAVALIRQLRDQVIRVATALPAARDPDVLQTQELLFAWARQLSESLRRPE